jgi:hypothetical protein
VSLPRSAEPNSANVLLREHQHVRGDCCTGSRAPCATEALRKGQGGARQLQVQVTSTQTEVVPKCSFDPRSSHSFRLILVGSSSLVLAADGGDNLPDGGGLGVIDAVAIDVSAPIDVAAQADAAVVKDVPVVADALVAADLPLLADAPWVPDVVHSADASVALDTSVVADTYLAVDTFVAIDLAAAGDGGAKAGDGGAGDGGSGPPPVYLPDGGNSGIGRG